MNVKPCYGKLVEVLLWTNWSRNATGLLQESYLGENCVCIMPLPKDSPYLKTVGAASVSNPLHIRTEDITGLFELEQSIGTKETTKTTGS